MRPKPWVGQIVHYIGEAGQCLAAIVTEVGREGKTPVTESHVIGVAVFEPGQTVYVGNHRSTEYADVTGKINRDRKPCTWHWPERDERSASPKEDR